MQPLKWLPGASGQGWRHGLGHWDDGATPPLVEKRRYAQPYLLNGFVRGSVDVKNFALFLQPQA
jgi:hypothetical protein